MKLPVKRITLKILKNTQRHMNPFTLRVYTGLV